MFDWRNLLYSSVRSFDELLRVVGGVLHRHHARAVFAGLGLQQNLVHLEIQAVRQQRAQHGLLVRLKFKNVRRRGDAGSSCAGALPCPAVTASIFPIGRNGTIFGCWIRVEMKLREQNVHRVHFALEEQILREFGNGPRLANCGVSL